MKSLLLKPWFTASVILIITELIVLLVVSQWKPFHYDYFFDDILSHVIGLLFDVIIVIFLFALINTVSEKRQRIERYKEEIEDFREWNNEEASFRLRGLIKRINKEKVSRLNLVKANLSKRELINANLQKADLSEANLTGAYLFWASLTGANLSEANLSGANLSKAIIELYQLKYVHLSSETILMDGTKYDESWAKRIAEAEGQISGY
jgi:hypothetical protein